MDNFKLYDRCHLDENRWNECVKRTERGNIYGLSWYLDIAFDNWAALVFGDYEAVMPFPIVRKIGVKIVPKPLFCQQLGVYGENKSPEIHKKIIKHFNKINHIVFEYPFNQDYPHISDSNYNHLLDLRQAYSELWQAYRPSRRNKIQKAIKFGWTIEKSEDLSTLIRIFKENQEKQIPDFKSTTYDKLLRLYEAANSRNMADLLVARHPQNNQIEAGVLCWRFRNVLTYQFCAASQLGRREEARSHLIDKLIQTYSGSNYILDFESTQILSFMDWNASFGAKPHRFSVFSKNASLLKLRKMNFLM